MKMDSFIIVSALAVGLAGPAMAQSSTMHRYAQFFKYSDSAVKAMGENPQDRSAAVAKLFEGFGGKVEASYWFPGIRNGRNDHCPTTGRDSYSGDRPHHQSYRQLY